MPAAELHIYGPTSILKGDYPRLAVREATSWAVEGAQFSQAFRRGVWDGRKHLFRAQNGSFPTGLVPTIKATLEAHDYQYTVHDYRKVPVPHIKHPLVGQFELPKSSFVYPYDFQLDVCKKMIQDMQGIVKLATNGGKCLAPETPVRMYDGGIRLTKDVQVGDKLMGPDGLPRVVTSTCTGRAPMFRVDQKRGMSYVCNDVHMLTLQDCRSKNHNETVDIALNEYLAKGSHFKHCFKHFSVGVEYPEKSVAIDPHLLGLWLGDGTKNFDDNGTLMGVRFTTKDSEIISKLQQQADIWDLDLVVHAKQSEATSFGMARRNNKHPNFLLNAFRDLFPTDVLRIPQEYLVNSREKRQALLAGILDSDGHYVADRAEYELTLKSKELLTDVYMLCRSLGYGVSPPREKNVKWFDGRILNYWRIHIRGAGPTNGPPTLLQYKRAITEPKKCATRTKFEVTALGEGDYAGFTLTGDGRFLLADYTVTHNTNIAASVTQYLGLNTLFIVTTRELLYQARKRFMSLLDVGEDQVGLVGDGTWEPGSWVTIATLDTLESRLDTKECQDLLKNTEVLFIDECHHAGSETWYTVATICPAFYRFGLSGTPLDRTDGANLRLIAACGDMIVNIGNKFLVERGISAKAHIIFDKVTEPSLLGEKTKHKYPTVYKKCVVENEHLLQKVVEWTKVFRELNMGTLILCEEIAQGKAIDDALWNNAGGVFLPHQFIHGTEDTAVRTQALADFADRSLPILVASTILDEGVDVPTIDALILAGSRKSRIKTMQRLGRGLRGKQLIVVEFANFCHGFLLEHSKQRLLDYKSEDCFPIHKSAPNVALVRQIMEETA